jgi:hypothetical protein
VKKQWKTANSELAIAILKFNTSLLIFFCKNISVEVGCDFTDQFEGGFELFDDFLRKYIGIGEIVGIFQAFVSKCKDVEPGLLRL